jgi:hypothetical protein
MLTSNLETVAESMASVAENLAEEGDFDLYSHDDGSESLSDLEELEMTDISQVHKRKSLSHTTPLQNPDAYNGQDDLPADFQVKSSVSNQPEANKSGDKTVLDGKDTPQSQDQQNTPE